MKALYTGKNIIHLKEVHSTNRYTAEMLSNSVPIADGSVIMADFQTAGKGQLAAIWESMPKENLLLSVYYRPHFLKIADQFMLSIAISLAICDFLKKYIENVTIKWPNDIYVGDQKIAGILIENSVQQDVIKNSIIGIGLNINQKDLFPDNWLYIHSNKMKMGRLTNFRNWVPQLFGNENSTICALEYWCYDEDDFWKWDEQQLIALAKEELRETGLIGAAQITAGSVYKIPRCYPVYSSGYQAKLKIVQDYLSTIENLHVIGRYGAFKYNNQDHSILMGILAAENILENKKHNLWEINTDYDSYQESSVITKTGLQKK